MDEFRKNGQILKYLNKYYYVKGGIFLNRYDEHEYGNDIIRELPKIFSVSREICTEVFKDWAESFEVEYLDKDAYGPDRLQAYWSPDFADDITPQYGFDAAEELMDILTQELAREIDAQILLDLRGQINSNELLEVIKCVGYEKGPTIYDPLTFSPRNCFTSMKKHHIEHARQNNPHWQNWIRTRR